MKIRKAKNEDVTQIFENINLAKKHMKNIGISQWKEGYPSFEDTKENINDTFVVTIENKIVGSVVLNSDQAIEYKKINWNFSDKNPLIVHRFVINPKEQGKGYARKLMDFIINFAKENGHKSIRLDTYSKNNISNKFYEKSGFKKVGEFYFKHLQPENYNAYELII
jgi:GNAT superfamily N-acetyltransferase